jgi:cobyrinic acid a,c-diamide synthase
MRVQPFKVGPDFIDPGFHTLVAGRPSCSLDGWMCSREQVRATVARQAADADLALVEGVMGCFDGRGAQSEEGSTAEIAKWLDAPTILVVDGWAVARSAGAMVLGFESFDPPWPRGGDLNRWPATRTGGGSTAVGALPGRPLGYLPRRDSLLPGAISGCHRGERGVPGPLLASCRRS